jgi:hypothetical protein
MKNKVNFMLLLLSATLMLFAACSKQRVELNEYSTPDEFMYNNRPEEQEFILNGDSGGHIIGNQGTHLWMDSSIFMHTNGNEVSYPIIIKLIEIYTPKDMELYAMPTVAQGELLVSGGEIRVRAFKDNEELVLKPNKVYYAKMPTQNPDPDMSLFYGKEEGDIIDWVDNASSVSTNPGIDALENIESDSAYFYNLFSPMMGWINCDRFANYPSPLTTVTFESNDDDLTNVMKYLYIPSINSVMQVYDSNVSGNVPVGEPVKVLCFAMNSSGALFHYYQEVAPAQNQVIMVTMTEISEADLIALMAGL